MKLKNKVLSISLMILCFIFIIIFSLLVVGRNNFNKDNIKESFDSFNYVEYINNNEQIKYLINSFIMPSKTLEYIDSHDVSMIVNNSIDKLYSDDSIIVDNSDIYNLIIDAVKKYDSEHFSSLSVNINDNIINCSDDIYKDINDTNNISAYRFLYSISNSYGFYIILVIILLLLILLVIAETWNGFLFSGVILVICSVIIYYMRLSYVNTFFANIKIFKYIDIINNINNICVIIFLIGLVLLMVYVVYLIKRLLYKIRLYSYDKNYWR